MHPERDSPQSRLPLTATERAALGAFLRWLRERFGSRVSEVRLFGSRARGERNPDSDVDVLVAISGLTSAERREIGQISGDAITDWDVLLSPLALSTEQLAELRARERRIAREIDHDGIAL
jgi:predicted nucleotidyltransferase